MKISLAKIDVVNLKTSETLIQNFILNMRGK